MPTEGTQRVQAAGNSLFRFIYQSATTSVDSWTEEAIFIRVTPPGPPPDVVCAAAAAPGQLHGAAGSWLQAG